MQIQFITTFEDLQKILDKSIESAFSRRGKITNEEEIDIIDTKALCERLNITEPTVIRWRKKGKIPFLQIGSVIRFNYPSVIKALEVTNRKGGRHGRL